ncbi:RWP-RK domain-containing protein, partial [Haematococcus lacustris]
NTPSWQPIIVPTNKSCPSRQDDEVVFIRPANGGEQRCITKALLQEVYHLPINEAADQLGVGVTVLKKFCRRFQVERWPSRKLKSLNKLISSVEELHAQDPQGTSYALAELQRYREEIYANPEVVLDDRIKRLRQANFKIEHKARLSHATEATQLQRQAQCSALAPAAAPAPAKANG